MSEMSSIHYLPQTSYAERTVMQAGVLVDNLKHVPLSELSKMSLCITDDEAAPPELVLVHLATVIAQIAACVAEYRLEQIKKEMLI
jgi:hypothetical protein